ncbi:6-phosphogluconolactonase [Metapseudomonas furukawaii]|uniref:6-phosphogluconolactonase n=1 Tax=Metapseudomonas furukawaii TaxID=1149133 RepID=A0AAD1C3F9_METFU|nr:6-phosphogluconolactonase [Pseudomonas furukawaii]ELS25991.1 6-phosphogluconolactonase, eukaryotic type [Pseudomonas furukawaii]BAU75861.1 6-phosphogluconolactonase [Pseudomonas furukawaii]
MAISNLNLPAQVLGLSLDNPAQLAGELALTVANALRGAIAERGAATLVVSGGRSPVAFFERLAAQELDWSKVTLGLADERFVPVSHPDSNEGLVRRHLLQGRAAAARFLGLYQPAPSVEASAQLADARLADLEDPDVLVLGMGEDGHTASFFPGSPNLAAALDPEGPRRCLPMLAPSVPRQRLTLTLPVLRRARLTLLSLQGAGKLATLADALAGEDVAQMPIRAFLSRPLEIYWCP